MQRERWLLVKKLFRQGAKLPPEERGDYLRSQCEEDSQLLFEVENLLICDDGIQVPLESRDGSLVGETIGPYHIEAEIGRGGTGIIYIAQRADRSYRQSVAIKVLKRGLDTDEILARFRTERQILASLDHPHIARILDGGSTSDGRPYVVMEHIEGQPIDDFCDEHRLTIDQRLDLFLKVCEAVDFAHRSLIVHRDLKPANILVTDQSTLKLLDFGIAKLLDPSTVDHTVHATRPFKRLLTPSFASPEQIRGETVTVASDVYSLGVILYELLVGRSPYRFESREIGRIEQEVCESVPEKPSLASRHLGSERAVSIAASRGTTSSKLIKKLGGDLDRIVLMALRKDPRRRYESARQLAEDIRRYRMDRPVQARGDSLIYRSRKLVQRRTVEVSFGLVLLLLLVGSAIFASIQALRIADERDKARQVLAYLIDIFEVSKPTRALGETITAREILDEGARRIVEEWPAPNDVQANLMDAIGVVYLNLGLDESAEPLLLEAYRIRREIFGERHLRVADSQHSLGRLYRQKGDFAESARYSSSSLKTRRALLGERHLDVADSLKYLGKARQYEGQYAEAEKLLRQSLEIRRQRLGGRDVLVADSLYGLAGLLSEHGRPEEAKPLFEEALDIQEALLGEPHPATLNTVAGLAGILTQLEEYEQAETLLRRSLPAKRKAHGGVGREVGNHIQELAHLVNAKGEYEEAESLYRESLAIYTEALGERHPNIATTLYNLATVLQKRGDLETAEVTYRKALAIRRDVLPTGHPRIAYPLVAMAGIALRRGDAAIAEPLLREAVALWSDSFPSGHWLTADAKRRLGDCLSRLERYDEAESLLVSSFEILREKRGLQAPRTQETARHLADLYRAWNRPEQEGMYRGMLDPRGSR